jgi:hypothetical protein
VPHPGVARNWTESTKWTESSDGYEAAKPRSEPHSQLGRLWSCRWTMSAMLIDE